MNPDYYVVIDKRGTPLAVTSYYDQAVRTATELTTTSNTCIVLPVHSLATVDKWLDVILQERLHVLNPADPATDC